MESKVNPFSPNFPVVNIKRTLILFNEWLSSEINLKPNSSELNTILGKIKDILNRAEEYVYTTKLNNRELNRLCEESRCLYLHYESIMDKYSDLVFKENTEVYMFYRRVKDKLVENKLIKYHQQIEKFAEVVYKLSNYEELKNDYPEIFKDSFAYSFFQKMHQYYKNKTHFQAYYSFLYYAMNKDKFIICSQSEFRDFITNQYGLGMDRVDYKQKGLDNKKYDLYNSIKGSLI